MRASVSPFKPNGWDRAGDIDAQIYHAAAALDGIAEILQVHLAEEVPEDARRGLYACCDLLGRVSDDLFHLANVIVVSEVEGV